MGFQNANENVLYGFRNLVIWHWKSFGYILKGVYTNHLDWKNWKKEKFHYY